MFNRNKVRDLENKLFRAKVEYNNSIEVLKIILLEPYERSEYIRNELKDRFSKRNWSGLTRGSHFDYLLSIEQIRDKDKELIKNL